MPEQQLDLPSEARELPQGAQQIFQAAFKSASEDGMSAEAATRVAWNSVNSEYIKGDDGSWQHKPDDTNQTRKSVQSGGN
ncbi:MAG TPA: ChaB family protein [Kamptonema sp.]|nr:ChaB family protein [Kamptonema sp.]